MKILRLCLILFCLGFIVQAYKPIGSVHKKYKSQSEKTKLFKDVGCVYSNALDIQYPEFNKLDAKKSKIYRNNERFYDDLSRRYLGEIQARYHAPMYLKWISDVVGYGVFAAHDIKKDDLIGEYSGVLREIHSGPDNLDYAWYYTIDGLNGKKLVIDGKYQGNELRFINHAKDPNTVRIDVLDSDNVFHIAYKADQDIAKDTQLTVSYGEGYFTSRQMKALDV